MYFYRQRRNIDELSQIYSKADAAHYKRYSRNKWYYTLELLTAWREKAEEKYELVRKGKLTADELREILKPSHIE